MDDFDTRLRGNPTERHGAIRVILFSDSAADWIVQTVDADTPVRVVDSVQYEDELLAQASVLEPDVILMLTDADKPTPAFSGTAHRLWREGLSDRVAILAGNPASYVNLAIGAHAAALLPANFAHAGPAGGSRRQVGAPRSNSRAGPSPGADTKHRPGTDREVSDMW
jgi:hypothetical protein